jgi:hypothetical protein
MTVAIALTLTGCGNGGGAAANSEAVGTTTTSLGVVKSAQITEWDVTRSGPAIVESVAEGWPLASFGGVVLRRGECLVLGGGGEAVSTDPVIVWPPGTVWDDADGTVVVPSSRSVAVGSSVGGAGGWFTLDRDETPDAILECVPPESDMISVVRLWPSGEEPPSVSTMTTTTLA